jgi:NTP pyrophosphatase (non-canonical NTP hydrolase)
MSEKFTNAPGENYEQDKAAEEISNASRDKIDDAQAKGQDVYDSTPKTPEEQAEKMGTAYKSKKILEEKNEKKKKGKGKKQEKFEIDLDNYTDFVDRVTSPPSKDFNALLARYGELKKQKCDIERLDTAASGLCSESGEFMEIVKKLKFQGKPYNDAQKEHLTKELGDILWYAAQASLALGVRLDEVIYINTLKLAARYPNQMFEVGYSENRAPGDI